MQHTLPAHPAQRLLRRSVYLLAVLLPALLWWTSTGSALIWDSHWYLELAEQLVLNQRYALTGEVFHLKYPPGFPLFIAVASILSSNVEVAGALLVLTAVIASSVLVTRLGIRLGFLSGILTCLLFNLHHLTRIHSRLILTEEVFSALVLGVIVLIASARSRAAWGSNAALALAGLASLVRYEGLLLFLLLAYRIRQDYRACPQRRLMTASWVPGLAFAALAWGVWVALVLRYGASAGGGSYTAELSEWMPLHALDFLLLGFWLGPFFLALAAWGIYRLLKSGHQAMRYAICFCALYAVVHALWWFGDIRFYVPILPWLCLAAAHALAVLAARACSPAWGQFALCALVSIALYAEQMSCSMPNEYEYRRFNVLYLDLYEPLRRLEKELPGELRHATFVVPDVSVYRRYLPDAVLSPYNDAADTITRAPAEHVFLILDTLHFQHDVLDEARRGVVQFVHEGRTRRFRAELRFRTAGGTIAGDDRAIDVYELSELSPGTE